MEKKIAKIISDNFSLSKDEIFDLIEIPPADNLGDYAFPCFSLAKIERKSPNIIAQELCDKLKNKLPKEISEIKVEGSYVNFFVDKKFLAREVFSKVKNDNFGKLKIDSKKIGIEYPAPNTNKSLHIGHLRNMSIGDSVLKICEMAGNEVFHLNLYNDRGILISKSMIGYEKFGKGRTPDVTGIKGDKFVGDYYVKFSLESKDSPNLEDEAKEKLRLWESGDKNTIEQWKKMNSWAYGGMKETFEKFGLSKIDKSYYESKIYKKGKEIVDEGLSKGIFYKKDDGAVAIDLSRDGLGEKILLRKDGTSVYIVQDLFLAEEKIGDFKLDSSYYVVGSDQEYHFKVLFNILEKLGVVKDWKHLSYGMVRLPSGKMKSREGSAIGADDLIDEVCDLASKGIRERLTEKLSDKEIGGRSLKIALSAIKYSLLKVDKNKGIVFDPKESISFEGDTGPYLLYAYARANSIIKKIKVEGKLDSFDLEEIELRLLKKIYFFEDVLRSAYRNLAPNLIANYCFELSKMFNEFYHACPIMGSEKAVLRLKITEAFKITLKRALELLGIDVLDEM